MTPAAGGKDRVSCQPYSLPNSASVVASSPGLNNRPGLVIGAGGRVLLGSGQQRATQTVIFAMNVSAYNNKTAIYQTPVTISVDASGATLSTVTGGGENRSTGWVPDLNKVLIIAASINASTMQSAFIACKAAAPELYEKTATHTNVATDADARALAFSIGRLSIGPAAHYGLILGFDAALHLPANRDTLNAAFDIMKAYYGVA
ncbi:MAG: hypothetical protein Q4G26_06960 [Paracoccus sp. (in: a-proteobacteria)]|nr:hypothetical protein [Paracoccus sp. (in: a-proteobacteria)]